MRNTDKTPGAAIIVRTAATAESLIGSSATLPDQWRGRTYLADLDMRIDREGVWYYQGSAVLRHEMVCLFASTLKRDPAGNYWLVTPREVGPVTVEDAPFLAVELFVSSDPSHRTLSVRTNTDEIVTIDDHHPLYVVHASDTGEPSPYVMIRDGLSARLTRSVYYAVVDLAVEEKIGDKITWGVWSDGHFFCLTNDSAD